METHKVPQQIQYRDEIFAGLTVRQVLIIGLFGIPAYAAFKAPIPFPIRVFLAVPVLLAGFVVAFYKHDGRFLEVWLTNWFTFHVSPHYFKPSGVRNSSTIPPMIKRIFRRSAEDPASVTTQVPIEGIGNGMIKTNTGYVMILACNAVNFRLMSEDARYKLWSGYRSFLNVLSLGFPIQFHIQVRKQTIDDIRKHFDEVIESQPSEQRRALAEAQRDFVINTVKESAVVSRSFYIAIPYLPNYSADLQTVSIFRQAFTRNRKRSDQTTFEVASKQLSTRREQVVTQLKKLGIEARQLDDEEIFELIYNTFNPSTAGGGMMKHDLGGLYETVEEDQMVEFLSPSYLRLRPDHADVAGIRVRTLFALDYPGTVYNGWIQPLVDLDQDLDISIHINPLNSPGLINILNKNLSKMISTRRYREHKGKMEDYHMEAKAEDSVYLLERLIRNETKVFNMGLYVNVRSLDPEELDEKTDSVMATLESMQVVPAVAKYQMGSAITTVLPLAQDRLCCLRNLESDGLADGMPLTSADLSSSGHILYGINSDNHSLVMYDRFSARNSNSVVLGSSGSGKSWYTKQESLLALLQGTYANGKRQPVSIVIIDPEREYEAICEAVGGQYVTISRNPNQHINPFDPYIDNVEDIRGIDRQVADAQVLIRLMAPELDLGKAQLEELLYSMFKMKNAPLIGDLYRLSIDRGMEDLTEAVYPWHQGSYRHIFSYPTDVDLSSDYLVFDISEMDEDLRPIAMQVILSWLWRNIFSNPKPRLIYVDEAWCLLKSAGDWFAAAYKRSRKHWAGFSLNDHEVETLLNSDVMKTVLTNSATKLLFSQEPSALGALTQAFDLTDGEQMAILGGSPGEGLLYAENSHVSLRVVSPPEFENFLSTSPTLFHSRSTAID